MSKLGVLNCGTGSSGTYFGAGCKPIPHEFVKAFAVSPLANIADIEADFNEAARALLIKKGLLIVLDDILATTEAGAKTNFETLANKIKLVVSPGIYEFSFEFLANKCLIKALNDLAPKLQGWGLMLIDATGKLWLDNQGTKLDGFEMNYFVVENESVSDGGSKTAKFMVSAQLTKNGTKGFNERADFHDSEEYAQVHGIQDVTISNAGTSVDIALFRLRVTSGCDKSTGVLGLASVLQVYNASTGVNQEVTWVDNNDGTYTPSGLVAGDMIVKLYDETNHSGVVDLLSKRFYQSNKLQVTFTD